LTDLTTPLMRKGPPNLADAIDRIKPDSGFHEMRDPFDIGDALTSLALSGEAVTVYRRGRDFVMARIDSVDPEGKVFTLDLAESGAALQDKVVFVAALGSNAKIQFELDAAASSIADRPDLLQFPLPEICQVLNRRAEPRLESPVGMNYGARFATPEQAMELYVGKKLEGVQLEMGGSLVVTADLEVRLLRPFRTFLLGPQVQVGCRISNISMQMHQTMGRAVEKIQKRR